MQMWLQQRTKLRYNPQDEEVPNNLLGLKMEKIYRRLGVVGAWEKFTRERAAARRKKAERRAAKAKEEERIAAEAHAAEAKEEERIAAERLAATKRPAKEREAAKRQARRNAEAQKARAQQFNFFMSVEDAAKVQDKLIREAATRVQESLASVHN